MTSGPVLRTAARSLLVALYALAPLTLGRFLAWETWALLLVVGGAALLWVAGGGALLPPRRAWPDTALLLGLLASILVTFWSVYLYESLLALGLVAAGLLTLWLTRLCLAQPAWNRAGWWALAAGAAAAGLWGLREYTHTAIISGELAWRTFGPFYNPNCLGSHMALLALVPVALAVSARTRTDTDPPAPPPRGKKRGRRPAPPPEDPPPRYPEIAGTACAVVLVLALLATGSKGAMLALLPAVILFAVLGAAPGTQWGRALRWGAVAVLVAAILAAFMFPPIRNRITAAFGHQQHSASFRVLTWQGTAEMAAARPLTGFGPGAFSRAFPAFTRAGYTRQAHQTPLQMAAEHGLPAALLLLAGIAGALWTVGRRAAAARGFDRLLPTAAVAGGVALWAHNLVDYTWYVAATHTAFWAMLGLAWAETGATEEDAPERSRRGWRAAGGIILAALMIWSAVGLLSEQQRASGARLTRLGALEAARQRLERVLPLDAYRWVELARVAEHQGRLGDADSLREAVSHRLRAASIQPTEPTHYTALGRLYAALGDLPAAEQAYARAVNAHPVSTDALLGLAQTREALGRTEAALEAYSRLAALYDTPVRTAQAIEYFVDETYAYAFMALTRDHLEAGRREDALRLSSEALRVLEEFIRSQRAYRQLLEVAGRYDLQRIARAEALAEEAMALLRNLDEPVADLRVGAALIALDHAEEGVGLLEALAHRLGDAREPDLQLVTASAYLRLAQGLEHLDRDAAARDARREGLRRAGQVMPRLTENDVPRPPGWTPGDTAWLQQSLAATGAD